MPSLPLSFVRISALLALVLLRKSASAEVVVLSTANYESATHGKSVFIKFYAPWCAHCREMADDWKKLADSFAGHKVALVGEVDCTSDSGQALCEDFEIQTFPTLLFGDPMSPETYDGKRDYDSMAEFAKNNINDPICSYFMKSNCNAEETKMLDELEKKSEEDLEAMAVRVETDVAQAEQRFDEEVGRLQVQYDQLVERFNAELDRIKKDNHYKYVEQILSSRFTGGNDEL